MICSWGLHLVWVLHLNFSAIPPISIIGTVLAQAFLNTGLFVTAHDAIHGLVCRHRIINGGVGAFCSAAYAALSYKTLRRSHWLHHRDPMGSFDPDFCDIPDADFWTCYQQFMAQYLGPKQLLTLAAAVLAVSLIGQVSPLNVVLFWGLPLLLSSIQLFYVGTYSPHQQAASRNMQHCCAPSPALPWLGSFLLCYHFSYHQEHHDYPSVPWWQLPTVYRQHLDTQNARGYHQ
ncbi:MAG: fatty acid desaturase [Leptolyngbyaceae cyanobacterium]